MNKQETNPIVYNLEEKDIGIIKSDLNLIYGGSRIIYFVDPFDVIEFAFPSLLDEFSTIAMDDDTPSQKYLAYDALFQQQSLPIVTKEYQLELKSLLSDLKREFHRYTQLRTRDKFLSYFLQLSKNPKVLQRKIMILVVFSIGSMNYDKVERIKNLVADPRFVLPATGSPIEQEILDDIILDTRPTRRVETVFDLFCKKEHHKLSKLAPDKKDLYLENTYRDIEVIDRIFEINQKTREIDRIKDKYVFQYLSSSPHKSPILFKLFMDVAQSNVGLNHNDFNFLRNINHFSVLDSILARYGATSNNMEEVEELLAISSSYNDSLSFKKKLSTEFQPLINGLETNININRDSLENTYTMYKVFTAYQEKARQAILELQKGSKEGLKEIIDNLYSYLQTNRDEKDKVVLALDNYRDENWIQQNMLRFFYSSGEVKGPKNIHITVYAGLDVIRSNIQLYPVLLFYKELSEKGSSLLNDLLLHVASPVSHQTVFIANKYAQVQEHEFFTLSHFERKIFYQFLQLILPTSPEKDSSPYPHQMSDDRLKKEREIIDQLERIYSINEKRSVGYVPLSDTKGVVNRLEIFYYPPLTVKIEICYFLSWMYRRVREYEKCRLYLDECLSLSNPGSEDPRLLHSRALCLISEAYENMPENIQVSRQKFSNALTDLFKAKELFEKRPANNLTKHILIGIENTLCDACVELFLLNGNEKEYMISNRARPLLDNLKNSLKEMGEKYENYPSYNHTEADLEYCEAVILYKHRRIEEAKAKISNSVKRLYMVDDTKLLQGNTYLNVSKRRIDKLAIRIHKNVNPPL